MRGKTKQEKRRQREKRLDEKTKRKLEMRVKMK